MSQFTFWIYFWMMFFEFEETGKHRTISSLTIVVLVTCQKYEFKTFLPLMILMGVLWKCLSQLIGAQIRLTPLLFWLDTEKYWATSTWQTTYSTTRLIHCSRYGHSSVTSEWRSWMCTCPSKIWVLMRGWICPWKGHLRFGVYYVVRYFKFHGSGLLSVLSSCLHVLSSFLQ